MSKKQVLLVSLLAALPAAFLLYVLIMAAVNHGGGVFAGLMWLFWGLVLAGGGFLAALPVLVQLFYPAEGFGSPMPAGGPGLMPADDQDLQEAGSDEEYEDGEEGFDDEQAEGDSGEQMFEEGAMDDDFEEFDGDFEEEQ